MAEPNSKFPKSQASQMKSDFNTSLKPPIVKFSLDPSPGFTSAFPPKTSKLLVVVTKQHIRGVFAQSVSVSTAEPGSNYQPQESLLKDLQL